MRLVIFLALAMCAFGADGEKVYTYWCATCHGPGLPGTVALETKYKGTKPALLTERKDLTPPVTKDFCTQRRLGNAVLPQNRNQRRGFGRASRIHRPQQQVTTILNSEFWLLNSRF